MNLMYTVPKDRNAKFFFTVAGHFSIVGYVFARKKSI